MPQKGSKKPNVSKALKGKIFKGTFKKGHKFFGDKKSWFKKGQVAWNKDTKGIMKPNSGSITSDRVMGEKNVNWKGGVTKEKGYNSMLRRKSLELKAGRQQPLHCELCGTLGSDLKKGLCYDHDHETGKFRGWLCGRCNTALGLVSDNSELLLKMSEYVKIK